jgi:hypothetical protein
MSATATYNTLDTWVSRTEIFFTVLDLLSGKGYPPFFNSQSYLRRVKEYYDNLDVEDQLFLKMILTWLRDSEPSARMIEYYRRCVLEKKEETRQWLNHLNVEVPSALMAVLEEAPTEQACREGLKDHAAYALELLNATAVENNS